MSERIARRSLVFVKLGGSLITDKRRVELVRDAILARTAQELAEGWDAMPGQLIVGHGSGSFGHAAARRLSFDSESTRARPEVVSEIQDAAARLHRRVVASLLAAECSPYSIVAGSAFEASPEGPRLIAEDLPLRLLAAGLLPVVYGDIVVDGEGAGMILATEVLFLALIRSLLARGVLVDRVLWLGETEGVLGSRGDPIPRLSASEALELAGSVGAAAGADVTGGMRLRLETASALAKLGVESWVLDGRVPGCLRESLRGRPDIGTVITPD